MGKEKRVTSKRQIIGEIRPNSSNMTFSKKRLIVVKMAISEGTKLRVTGKLR